MTDKSEPWFDDVVGKCPDCGFPTCYENGIEVCYYCGWSEEQEKENDFSI